jgi:ribonuclease HI
MKHPRHTYGCFISALSERFMTSLDPLLQWLLVLAGGGTGALLLTLDGEQFKYMVHLEFKATNNMAESKALIIGLCTTLSLWVRQLLVMGDSQPIIKQVNGECCCNDP